MVADSAWCYLVVSSDKQADSIESQALWAQQTAQAHGWELTRTFRGVSTGASGARKLLEDLLGELERTPKSQRPERVLMSRLDRTGRGFALEPLAALAQIYRLGVLVHSREDGDVSITRASDSIKPILRVLTGALENEARADKARAGHERKRREGKHAGHPPYGIILKDGIPEPYEPEAQVIRALFAKYLDGWGKQRLASYAAKVAPDKRKADGSTRPMAWNGSTIVQMLRCRTYRQTVVDEPTFDAVQTLKRPVVPPSRTFSWPLRGALRCTCGRILTSHTSGRTKRYYVCRRTIHEKTPMHNADRLEAQFLDLLRNIHADPKIVYQSDVNTKPITKRKNELEQDLVGIEKRRKRVWELYELGSMDPEQIRARLAELEQAKTNLEYAVQQLDKQLREASEVGRKRASLQEMLSELVDKWERVSVEHQRGIAVLISQAVGGLWCDPQDPHQFSLLECGL